MSQLITDLTNQRNILIAEKVKKERYIALTTDEVTELDLKI